MFAITTFQNVNACVSKLFATISPRQRAWKALKVTLVQLSPLTSPLLAVYLGMVFLLEILCITASVLALGRVPWYMYMFFPRIGVQAFVVRIVMFNKLIFIYEASERLQQRWILWCAMKGSKCFFRWKVKLKFRQLKALQPIGFSYSSLGTITKTQERITIFQIKLLN